jgi:hypothetical protein
MLAIMTKEIEIDEIKVEEVVDPERKILCL